MDVYGKSKCAAEEKIRNENPHALIIRTTIVYGPEDLGKNFVYQLSERLSKNERMSCVSDQFSTPTYNRDSVKMASSLVDARCSGIYNCVGQELMSRYEFALKIARALGFDENLIDAVTTAELQIKLRGSGQSIAARGMKLGLRVRKTLDTIPNLKLNSVEDSLEDWLRHPRGKFESLKCASNEHLFFFKMICIWPREHSRCDSLLGIKNGVAVGTTNLTDGDTIKLRF